MPIGELLIVGDPVSITIEKENRDWGYNPCPDGTVATVLGFAEISWGRVNNCGNRPGIHTNHSWVKLRMPDGQEHHEFVSRVSMVDQQEYARREHAWRQAWEAFRAGTGPDPRPDTFLRELPDTPFWEHDIVRDRGSNDPWRQRMRVRAYHPRWARDLDFYDCDLLRGDKSGGSTYIPAVDLELVERGNVWKLAHGETPVFKDLQEEAQLAENMGLTVEVANPDDGFYHWSLPEAIDAVTKGLGHSVSLSGPLFGGLLGSDPLPAADSDTRSTRIQVKRFKDDALGQRVRAATIEGFKR